MKDRLFDFAAVPLGRAVLAEPMFFTPAAELQAAGHNPTVAHNHWQLGETPRFCNQFNARIAIALGFRLSLTSKIAVTPGIFMSRWAGSTRQILSRRDANLLSAGRSPTVIVENDVGTALSAEPCPVCKGHLSWCWDCMGEGTRLAWAISKLGGEVP